MHVGNSISNDRERNLIEEVESVFCEVYITATSLNCSATEDHETGGVPRPGLPARDGSPPRFDPTLLIHHQPLLGPFENFPGTQFWEDYWHRKRMIKWDHWQLLIQTMSVTEIHRCMRDMINHHGSLLRSIENQSRDGMAAGTLLCWLLGDHAQLLETSIFVLEYFQTFRIPLVVINKDQNSPQQLGSVCSGVCSEDRSPCISTKFRA